jgi:hypothetical protein
MESVTAMKTEVRMFAIQQKSGPLIGRFKVKQLLILTLLPLSLPLFRAAEKTH